MTIDEALEQVEPGGSISQTVWTDKPGFETEPGFEYQMKLTVTKKQDGTYDLSQQYLGKRQLSTPQ